MSINEEETMKSFFRNIDFEKIHRNAKRKSKLSILITLPLTLISLIFIIINWDNNNLFLNNFYSISFWIPSWIALFCSILSYKFKNALALERFSKAPKTLIYIPLTLPIYTIISSTIFKYSLEQQVLVFTIIACISACISLVSLIVIVVSAIHYEKKNIDPKESFIKYLKKQGLSESEIEDLFN